MNPTKKESKMSTSVKVTRAAWRVMMLDKEVLGIGAIAMACNVVLFVAIAAIGMILLPNFFTEQVSFDWKYYLLLAGYFLAAYSITNYFGGAISHSAFRRFEGEDPTMRESLVAAQNKIGALTKFTLLQSSVGLVLNIIADRVPFAGRIAVWLVGAAWGVATMFAIPVIMSSNEANPLKVVKKSAQTFVAIWAESVFIGLTLGFISIAVTIATMFVVVGLIAVAIGLGSVWFAIAGGLLLVAVVVGITLVMNTLQQIVMTAAYYYASTGRIPAGFDEELVRAMFRPKKKWLA